MTGIEPVSCDIWSARSANYATTTLNFLYKIVSTKIEDLIKQVQQVVLKVTF